MNRSAHILVFAAAVCLSLGYWLGSAPRAEAQAVRGGNYQIMEGTFYINEVGEAGRKEHTTMFKVNTQTGKAWRYVERVNNDRWVREWLEIE